MTFTEEFKARIYNPYTEAWAIMKTLKSGNVSDQDWQDYMSKCDEFKAKYPSEIGSSIYRVMLDCGSEVERIGSLQ